MIIKDDFLLKTKTSVKLYEVVKDLPIIDFHSHLSAEEIFTNKRYEDIGQMWLEHDHYKWRAMRTCGIDESYITGNKTYKEKYDKWAQTMEYTLFNPLYHWTHLELKKYFGINLALNLENSQEIYDISKEMINSGKLDVQNIIESSNVEYIATTDDPIDQLNFHKGIANSKFTVVPTFRPDRFYDLSKPNFNEYIQKLEKLLGKDITNIESFLEVLLQRLDYFIENNCKISDHGIDKLKYYDCTKEDANSIFIKKINGENIQESEIYKFMSFMLSYLLDLYSKKGIVTQLHIGVFRNNNKVLRDSIGVDVGCDSVSDSEFVGALGNLLGNVENLPKTILYCLNPGSYYALSTMIGNFQCGPTIGKLQLGSAWWHADNIDGTTKQLTILSQTGLLRTFVGMLTDSRSFLSFSRHDYFRRVLCNYLGNLYEDGHVEQKFELVEDIAKRICYYNAKEYFEIER